MRDDKWLLALQPLSWGCAQVSRRLEACLGRRRLGAGPRYKLLYHPGHLAVLVLTGLAWLVSQANMTPGGRAKVPSPFSLQNLTQFWAAAST